MGSRPGAVAAVAARWPERRQTRRGGDAAAFGLISLLLISGCASAPRGDPGESAMEYLRTVEQLEAEGSVLEPGSELELLAIERFQALLSDLKAPDFRRRIREVYAEEVFFDDTLKTLRGVEAVEEYLAASAAAVDQGTVEFVDLVAAQGNYYFRWVMTLRFRRFARGEEKRSVGMTHVRFDAAGKVVLHQDYWDSARGLWDHVPALGWMLRRAKSQL